MFKRFFERRKERLLEQELTNDPIMQLVMHNMQKNWHEVGILSASQTKGSQRQTVYLSNRVRKAVSAYLGDAKQLTAHQMQLKLLQTQKGGGFTSATIQQLFRELYRAAGISNASSHSGRRSFITKLAHSGVNTAVIRELARHQNLATTQRYIDVSTDKLRGAVELVS